MKINRIKTLPVGVKSTIVYTISSLFTKGLSIITIPLFTRFLSTSEMGVVTIYSSWYAVLSVIISLGVDSGSFNIAMMEFKEERNKYMSVSLTLSAFSALFFLLIYLSFSDVISSILELPNSLILIMCAGFFVNPAYNMWTAKHRFEYNYRPIFWVSITSVVTASLFAVLSVIYFKGQENINLGVVRLLANNIVMYGMAAIFFIYIFVKGKTFFEKKYVKFTLVTSSPLIIHSLSKQILDVSDRMMISKFIGQSAVGIYGVLYSVSSISLIFWTAINNSIIPFMFSSIDHSEEKEKSLNNIIEYLLIFYATICIILTLFAPEIVRVLATEEYYNSIYLMPPIAAGIFFTALYNIFANVLLYYKKTSLIMISTITTAVINIILNYIFIPRFGYVAAAYTTLISYVVLSTMQYLFMNYIRDGKRLFNISRIVKISSTVTIITLLINILYLNNVLRFIFIFIFIVIVFWNRAIFINALSFIRNKNN